MSGTHVSFVAPLSLKATGMIQAENNMAFMQCLIVGNVSLDVSPFALHTYKEAIDMPFTFYDIFRFSRSITNTELMEGGYLVSEAIDRIEGFTWGDAEFTEVNGYPTADTVLM